MSTLSPQDQAKRRSSWFVNLDPQRRIKYNQFNDLEGRTRFPFLDTRQIRDTKNTDLRFHQAQKHGDPVMVADRPWESGVEVYGTVLHDGSHFRMWYESILTEERGNPYEVGYAESADGIHWDKPDLGLVELNGSRANNLVNFRGHSPSVIDLGSAVPAEERFLAIAIGYAPILGVSEVLDHPQTKKHHGYWAYYSSDGLAWHLYPRPDCAILPFMADTCCFAGDPYRGRVLGGAKLEPRVGLYDRRSVAMTTSPMNDPLNWDTLRLALYPDEMDDRMARERGCRFVEFYAMGLMPTRDVIVGFPEVFWVEGDLHPSQAPGIRLGYHGKGDIQLVYSYDGYAWHRAIGRKPFICLGDDGAWDDGFLTVRSTAVEVGDDVFVYYGGSRSGHSNIDEWIKSKIGLAKIKRDRFASIASDGDGMVEVYHGEAAGRDLVVNARTNKRGAIRVEALTATRDDSSPVPGFAAAQCTPITGDAIRLTAQWGEKRWSDVPRDAEIILRFYLENAEIFAYELVDVMS